jgi:hypothetical protein
VCVQRLVLQCVIIGGVVQDICPVVDIATCHCVATVPPKEFNKTKADDQWLEFEFSARQRGI